MRWALTRRVAQALVAAIFLAAPSARAIVTEGPESELSQEEQYFEECLGSKRAQDDLNEMLLLYLLGEDQGRQIQTLSSLVAYAPPPFRQELDGSQRIVVSKACNWVWSKIFLTLADGQLETRIPAAEYLADFRESLNATTEFDLTIHYPDPGFFGMLRHPQAAAFGSFPPPRKVGIEVAVPDIGAYRIGNLFRIFSNSWDPYRDIRSAENVMGEAAGMHVRELAVALSQFWLPPGFIELAPEDAMERYATYGTGPLGEAYWRAPIAEALLSPYIFNSYDKALVQKLFGSDLRKHLEGHRQDRRESGDPIPSYKEFVLMQMLTSNLTPEERNLAALLALPGHGMQFLKRAKDAVFEREKRSFGHVFNFTEQYEDRAKIWEDILPKVVRVDGADVSEYAAAFHDIYQSPFFEIARLKGDRYDSLNGQFTHDFFASVEIAEIIAAFYLGGLLVKGLGAVASRLPWIEKIMSGVMGSVALKKIQNAISTNILARASAIYALNVVAIEATVAVPDLITVLSDPYRTRPGLLIVKENQMAVLKAAAGNTLWMLPLSKIPALQRYFARREL